MRQPMRAVFFVQSVSGAVSARILCDSCRLGVITFRDATEAIDKMWLKHDRGNGYFWNVLSLANFPSMTHVVEAQPQLSY